MSKPGILLIQRADGWELSIAQALSPARAKPSVLVSSVEPKSIAADTQLFAKLNSLDPGRIVIAMASESVLFATLAAGDAIDIKNNTALRFALESVLPIDAESIVADSMPGDAGVLAAVAMEVTQVDELVQSLEELQCKVQCIVPQSLLTFEQVIADKRLPAPSVSLWISSQGTERPRVEILSLGLNHAFRNWQLTEIDSGSIERHLLLLNADKYPLFLFGSTSELMQLTNLVERNHQVVEIDRTALLSQRASTILSGRADPWIDLRRDALASQDRWRPYRKSIRRLAIASCLLVLSVCCTLLWRARECQALVGLYEQNQQSLFKNAFPDQRIPAAILGRLKSELSKASGIRKTDTTTLPAQSAMAVLRKVVESLTEEFPFEVEEIRIDSGTLAIEMELKHQEDAGKIASALAMKGFRVEPPATALVDGERILASFVGSFDSKGIR